MRKFLSLLVSLLVGLIFANSGIEVLARNQIGTLNEIARIEIINQQLNDYITSDTQFVSGWPSSEDEVHQLLQEQQNTILDLQIEINEGFSIPSESAFAYLSEAYSVSPSVLLTLAEMEFGVFSNNPKLSDERGGLNEDQFSSWLQDTTTLLSRAFYEHYGGNAMQFFSLNNGKIVETSADNSSTYALRRYAASQYVGHQEWDAYRIAWENIFVTTYEMNFGSATLGRLHARHPTAEDIANLPTLKIPWEFGDTWDYNTGPHNFDYKDPGKWPLSGVDLQPTNYDGCGTEVASDRWIAASASGITVDYKDYWLKLDHDFDGDVKTGWQTVYGHIANRIGDGVTVQQGDRLGNPSCYPIGDASGVHLHFGIKWEDKWQPIHGTVISGWKISDGEEAYHGYMSKTGQTQIESCFQPDDGWECKDAKVISDNGGGNDGGEAILYSDHFHNGSELHFPGSGTFDLIPEMNDQASSLRLRPGWGVTLYEHSTFDPRWPGGKKPFWTSDPDFVDDTFDNREGVNDQVSSLQAYPTACSAASTLQMESSSLSDPCPPHPQDNADLVNDVTIPDGIVVSPGQPLLKTWRMRNTGSTSWGSGYQLVFINGEQMGAPSVIDVPITGPGKEVNLSVGITAPTEEGYHTGYWRLRNPQGTYFGDQILVTINVVGSNPGTGRITMFDVSPPSPTEASTVHIVGRIRDFPEFRAMRFTMGNEVNEMTNFQQIGDQLEISVDWQTANLPRGNYTIMFEVASNGDPDWANPERRIQSYTLTGSPAPVGHPPDRPVLESPYDWYLKDASGASAPVRMCVYATTTDPDGDAVQYIFETESSDYGIQNSGPLSNNCWEPTLSPAIYSWRAKASDGVNESDWSQDTWHFSVAKGGVYIGDINFFDENTNNTHMCVFVTYDGIQGPEVRAWLNKAPDGSENGEWRLLDHYGPNTTPDCTQPNYHGFWIRSPEYKTGNHLVKISAVKPDSGSNETKTTNYNIAYIRPPSPVLVAPSTQHNNGTWWNDYEIEFWWNLALRTESQELRVSTDPDLWNDPSPLLSIPLGAAKNNYTHTFGQDYPQLYWGVKTINSAGNADTGSASWFGIDHVEPTCLVQPLSEITVESVFQVSWAGDDDSAGLYSFDIQYLDSTRGTWSDWLVNIPATKTFDLFTGQPGHSYEYRCRATDNAGNMGDYPSTSDTSILVDPASRPPTPWWDDAYSEKRNLVILNNMQDVTLPVGYPVLLHFDSSTTPSAEEIYDASLSATKCDDLRIVHNDTTEIDRLVESCTSSEIDLRFRTQISIPGGASEDSAHQLYYGNASPAPPLSDPLNVWPPPDDPNSVGIWYLSEGSGNSSSDLSGTGNHITSIGSLSWIDGGKFGNALNNSSLISGPPGAYVPGNDTLASSDFTFEAWVKRGSISYGILAAQGESDSARERWVLGLQDGRLKLSVWPWPGAGDSQFFSDSNFLPDTDWHHVAVTFDGARAVRFYRDGSLMKSGDLSQSGVNTTNYNLYIGSGFQPSAERFNGTIDQVRFSNVVRTSFPYGSFAAITTDPTLAAGTIVYPPEAGNPDLILLDLATFPYSNGQLLIRAVFENQGELDTVNGFYTDLYVDHVPAGPGDLGSSIQFWIDDPIEAGTTVTLTKVIYDLPDAATAAPRVIGSVTEIAGTLYAQVDSTGVVSETDNENNIYIKGVEACIASADKYEYDDAWNADSPLPIGERQAHNIHQAGDEDWISIQVNGGQTYMIQTLNLGPSADTDIYLYETDGTTLINSNDDSNGSLGSEIVWSPSVTGIYYLQVKHWNSNVGGCGTYYDIWFSESYPVFLPVIPRSN